MIISHRYKYLFVELPYTASTTISSELRTHYSGYAIINKHAHYSEFMREASEAEKGYYTFACIRNPLDVAVSVYFKRKTNHQGFYTNPENWRINGGHVTDKALLEFNFITKNDADFGSYFREFYKFLYDSWGCPAPSDYDFIIRHENLQQDFNKFLEVIRIDTVRPLPVVNKTSEKQENYLIYYQPDLQLHAVKVFGPYMKLWNYFFPQTWGETVVPWSSWTYFRFLRLFRKTMIKHELSKPKLYRLLSLFGIS